MKFARISDGVVQEVIVPPAGFQLSDCLHPDLISAYQMVPDHVSVGMNHHPDGTFTPMAVEEVPVVVSTLITPAALQKRFTAMERANREAAMLDDINAESEKRVAAAKLRSLHADVMDDIIVDLKGELAAAYLEQHETMGLVTTERHLEILTADVTPDEQQGQVG